MVRDIRIKEYIFPQGAGSATTMQQYTDHSINGELLRVIAQSNFTGSVILQESGTGNTFCNYTSTSGTNAFGNFNFTVTTGSFTTNGPILLTVGSLASGTAVLYGPIKVLYR